MSRIVLIPALILALLGSLFLYNAYHSFGKYKNERRAESWPTVQGEVLRSRIDTYEKEEWDARERRVRVTMYKPEITYQYEVDGNRYSNNRYGFFLGASKKRIAILQLLKQYKVGSEVSVYYNPDAPDDSILVQQNASSHSVVFAAVMFTFGAGAAIGAIMLLVLALKRKNPAQTEVKP